MVDETRDGRENRISERSRGKILWECIQNVIFLTPATVSCHRSVFRSGTLSDTYIHHGPGRWESDVNYLWPLPRSLSGSGRLPGLVLQFGSGETN